MASHPVTPNAPEFGGEPRLSAEEGWELIFSLFGSAREMFAEYGGGEAYLRAERAAWDQDETT